MTLTFLSEPWFAAAREVLDAQPGGSPDVGARLQFIATDADAMWVEVVEAGRTVELRAGELADPDLIVHLPAAAVWASVRGELDGGAVLGLVRTATPDHPEQGPPSPVDLGIGVAAGALPRIPGADLQVQYTYQHGPWGEVPFALRFVDGRIASMGLRHLDDPDVEVGCTYRQMALVRRGDLSIFDVLVDGGTVSGSEGALALLGGISESPEFQAVERACGPSGLALAALGEAHRAPGVATGMAELAARAAAP